MFVLTAALLMSLPDVLFYTFSECEPLKGLLIFGANYMMSLAMWLIVRLAAFIRIRRTIEIVFFMIVSLWSALLWFCWRLFGAPLDKGMIALITGTNAAESQEFFRFYITPMTVTLFFLTAIVIFYLFFWLTKYRFSVSSRLLKSLGVLTLGACCCLGYSFYTLPGRFEGILRTEQRDLTDYLHHPRMEAVTENHPDVVMIIIGESFSRSHSSLYGYDKPTNPRLSQLADKGLLTLFHHPIAAATHTSEAFQYFMTDYTHTTTAAEWYECQSLPELLEASGYKTAWFSNQARTGWYDNLSGAFAKLCQYVEYTSRPEDGEQGSRPDSILFKPLQRYLHDIEPGSRHVVFVHLMGHHVDFEQRYPSEYAVFKPEQYATHPKHQRENYATYDNATLYNDYIVDSLFASLGDRQAVGVYFSDHGLDFYESDLDYCSHANDHDATSVEAGLKIPMMVYATEQWKTANPAQIDELRQVAAHPFNTEQLPQLILQIVGYHTIR